MADGAIVHILVFDWNDQVTPALIDRFHARLVKYAASAEGVIFFECGSDIGLMRGNAGYGIAAKFEDAVAFERYRDHPEHLALTAEDLVPIIGDRFRVQIAEGTAGR